MKNKGSFVKGHKGYWTGKKNLIIQGKPLSEDHKRKIGLANRGKALESGRWQGEKHWNWKGGKTDLIKRFRETSDYQIWRIAVFTRDNYTCQGENCGRRGGDLEADHIKPISLYPELALAIDNGRTLCVPCHRKTETYGRKIFLYNERIIN